MPATATPRSPLGATTLNRKWYCDIVGGTDATPTYTGLFGITEFKFNSGMVELVDSSDFDSDGWTGSEATSAGWGAEGKLRRGVLSATPTAYDPGQELLRNASRSLGNGNLLKVRIYEMEPNGPRVEAWLGTVSVTYSDDGGDMKALSKASFTLIGKGKPAAITHPATA